MLKNSFFLIFFLSFALVTSAKAYENAPQIPIIQQGFDFREFVLGVTKEDVRRYEKAAFYQEKEDSLYFLEKPSKRDYRRLIKYDFMENRLVAATYDFQEYIPPSPDQATGFYEDFKRSISRAKGSFEKEEFLWGDKLYSRYPQFWGRAIRSGDLKVKTIWNLDDGGVAELSLGFRAPYYALTYKVRKKDSQQTNIFETVVPKSAPMFINP